MKKLGLASAINLDEEIDSMAQYLATRWAGIPAVKEILTLVRDQALHDARYWFDDMEVSDVLSTRAMKRQAMLRATLSEDDALLAMGYDQSCRSMLDIWMSLSSLKTLARNIDAQWDFGKNCTRAYAKVLQAYPEFSKAKPLGWNELYANYGDFDGMEEYCTTQQKSDEEAFQGHDTAGCGASNFVCNTALPYVMYDEVCQGRRAPYTLVSATYGHFLRIVEKRNSGTFIHALKSIDWKDEVEAIVFDVPINTSNTLLLAAMELAFPEGQMSPEEAKTNFDEAQKARQEFRAMPKEEQERIQAENKARVNAMLREVLDDADKPLPEKTKNELSREDKCRAILLAA